LSEFFLNCFYFIALTVLALFGVHKYYLLYLFKKYRKCSAHQPPPPAEWPEVVLQLPLYNERYVLGRLLRAAANLDYPREKLHIQVLDDSTDRTVRLASRLVTVLKKRGYRIDHVHRKSRDGFKAGALENGLKKTSAHIMAVFDADFIPQPDFLKKTIPFLLQPGIGMVQTRWGHINRNYSILTRLQAIFLDGHFAIEHLARNRSGKFFNFNGTAGIWRRRAIEDAGGWKYDTLTEDLDISYRAQLAGWKFIYLPDIISPAELPVDMNSFKTQQHRWAKGSIQTGLKLLPRIWRSNFPFHIRLEATVHLTNNLAYLLMAVPAFLMIPILEYHIEMERYWPGLVYLFVFFMASFSVMTYYTVTVKYALGKIWPHILYIPVIMALGIGLTINNGFATLEALFHYKSPFVRTPKYRIESRRDTLRGKIYKSGRTYLYLIELGLGIYFSYSIFYFLSHGLVVSLPFLLLFQFGFLYTSFQSFLGQISWSQKSE